MNELAFTRAALDDYRRWLGTSEEMRVSLQQRYPTRETAIEAMEYGNFSARRDAIRVLGALGEVDAVRHYAEVERESSWIPTLACEILVQPPLEILVAWITRMRPSGDGSRVAEVINSMLSRLSFAHIGDVLLDFLAHQKQKLKTLSPREFTALGLSGLPQARRLLQAPYSHDTLRTYAQALEAGVARKQCRPAWVEYMLGEEHRALDRASTSAIAAAVALRRLGQPVDVARVQEWLRQLEQLFPTADRARPPVSDFFVELRWVLFDAGDEGQRDALQGEGALRVRHDVAMTLLRRGDSAGFERWMRSMPPGYADLVHPPRHVHYWPLIDQLHSLGMIRLPNTTDGYLLSRAAGIAAPHGWVWKTEPA